MNAIKKLSLVALVGGALALGFTGCPSSHDPIPEEPTEEPETPEEPTKPDYSAEIAAITKAADRLVLLQNGNGSWNWEVTDATGPTTTTYLNIAGVTGHELLDAHEHSSDSKYLNAAKKAGDYIMTELDKLPENRHFNAFNMVFLKELAEASGDVKYSDYVAKKWGHLKTKVTLHPNGNLSTDGNPGLTAEELVTAEEVIRGTSMGGIKPWDLYHFVELAQDAGDNAYATALANGIKKYVEGAGYVDTIDSYGLGLAAAFMAMKNAGIETTSTLEKLVAKQNADGSFDEGTQAAAYILMALKEGNRTADAKKISDYLVANQRTDGGWLDGGAEYSEITSEAGHTIAKYISE